HAPVRLVQQDRLGVFRQPQRPSSGGAARRSPATRCWTSYRHLVMRCQVSVLSTIGGISSFGACLAVPSARRCSHDTSFHMPRNGAMPSSPHACPIDKVASRGSAIRRTDRQSFTASTSIHSPFFRG